MGKMRANGGEGTWTDAARAAGNPVRASVASMSRLRALLSAARADFGASAFWNAPPVPHPLEDALLVVGRLRRYGGRKGWKAAASIEAAIGETRRDGADG